MDRLGRTRVWLADQLTPAVAVIASQEADSLCHAANGLTVVNLLRPFGVLNQLNGTIGVPVRTVGEAPFRLHSWRLRFYAANTMFQPAAEAADGHLKEVLSAAAATACDEGVPPLEVLLSPDCGDATPWYGIYRDEFVRLMAFGDHETMDHPVACVLVLPSTVRGDPVAAFEELFARPGSLPALMQQGVMEPRIPKHYVLLHDARTAPPGTLERAQNMLRHMAGSIGQQCHLLVINSRTEEQPAGIDQRFWSAALPGTIPGGGAGEPASYPAPPPGGAYGAGLSESDVRSLAEFARNLAVQHIIPNLEMRIRALNHQVTSTRKGLRNQLKSLLWRKAGPSSFLAAAAGVGATDSPSSTAPSTPTAVAGTAGGSVLPGAYLHSSVEGEMRALSDLALLLRDFETALGTLRLLASDYKQDKAWKHYAAVQEALGVATILSIGSPADAVASYKEAFYRYQQVAQLGGRYRTEGTRYATRAAMVLLEYLRAIGQHGEANWICMKAHFQEENLRAGLLLEQAAHSLLRLAPSPHVRKFAFHLVLAGLRYNLCEQKGLALRAYKQVLGVYSGRRWALIEEHLHDVLGRQSREAGDWLGAVQHYMAMVLCPANSPYCQRAYMAQFLDVLRGAQAALGYDPTLELPVPVINLERVGLQYDSQTGYGTPEARQVGGEVWRPLEAAVQPPAEGGPLTWLDGGSRAHMAHQQPEHSCIVGETVGIDIELSNPLQIDLALTRLRLACSFEPAAAAAASAAHSGSAAAGAVVGGADRPKNPGLQIREESLTLGPGERMVVHLRLVPLRAGSVTVEGVQWVLAGLAQGCQRFRIPRPKPRKPGSSKPLLDAVREPPGGVHFTVLPPMPHLEVSTPPLSPVMLVGELLRCPLRLRNTGAMTMHNIAMAVATPDMLLTAVEVLPVPPAAAAAAAPAGPDISGAAVISPTTGGSTDSTLGPNSNLPESQAAAAGPEAGREAPDQQQQHGSSDSSAHSAGPAVLATDAAGGGDSLSHQLEGLALATSARSSPAGTAPLPAPAPEPGLVVGAAQPGPGSGLPPRGPRTRAPGGVVEVVVSERPGGMTVFSLPPGSSKLGVGQELQLVLWLRPTQPGAVRFNSVWCYEPVVKLDSVRFRTLRVTYSAAVQPSLDLAAAAVAGRSVPGTCLLQLRGVNRQGVEALRLTELACPGEAWQLSRLQQAQQAQQQQQQTRGGGSSCQELDTVVGPESAVTLHYHLLPADSAAAAAAPGVDPPASGLCGPALSSAVAQWFFRRAHPRRRVVPTAPSTSSLQSVATGRSTRHQTSAAASVVEDGGEQGGSGAGELSASLDLVVRWEVAGAPTGAQPRCGFHVVYQQRVQEGPPIHVQLLGPGRVAHDFDVAPFCTLQLVLRVRNTLPSPAAVCVETGKGPDGRPTPLGMATWAPSPAPPDGSMPSTSSSSSSGGYVQPVQPHIWCGRTRVTLPDLPSCQTVEVPLHVAASEPGMLHLADYLVSWSYPEVPALSGSRPGPPCVVQVQQRRRQQLQQEQLGGGG